MTKADNITYLPRNGGWMRAQCNTCLKIFKAGRPTNGPGIRWARQGIENQAKYHHCIPPSNVNPLPQFGQAIPKSDTKMLQYTTTEFAASIRRELKLRQEAYTRIALKAEKKFLKEAEEQRMTYAEAAQYVECKMIGLTTVQRLQYELLDDALRAIEHGQPLAVQHAQAVLMELHREMKCRKSYYGFLIWKKRLDKETADYEKAVWAALIEHWKEEYCTPARDDWYFDTGKLGYQDF